MFKSAITTFLVLALAVAAQAKICYFNNDWGRFVKSVVVYDQDRNPWNSCVYWNWHAQNLVNWNDARTTIKHVCWKKPLKEIGFILESAIGQYPDRYFNKGPCTEYAQGNIKDFLTTTGWDCLTVAQQRENCRVNGFPLLP
ncbi:hypothetical protein HDU96_004652 [Phlyctochytrium bullatum]|nr:hypothetical protein HDU96_004652 [Phlyctochytrium bullatum]